MRPPMGGSCGSALLICEDGAVCGLARTIGVGKPAFTRPAVLSSTEALSPPGARRTGPLFSIPIGLL